MKLVTVFISTNYGRYKHLLTAFSSSVRSNSKIPYEIITVKDANPRDPRYRFKINTNSQKLNIFNEIVQATDEDIIFTDCDMILTQDISELFDMVQTIGYTYADYPRSVPFNGGVLVVKNNPQAKDEFNQLTELNNLMVEKPLFHSTFRTKYQGINQSAMGAMLERGATWTKLPMSIYNLAENWHVPIAETKLIHYKGRLQDALFIKPILAYRHFVQLWYGYLYSQPEHATILPPREYKLDIAAAASFVAEASTPQNLSDLGPRTHANDPGR
jgi:hypothetical protein